MFTRPYFFLLLTDIIMVWTVKSPWQNEQNETNKLSYQHLMWNKPIQLCCQWHPAFCHSTLYFFVNQPNHGANCPAYAVYYVWKPRPHLDPPDPNGSTSVLGKRSNLPPLREDLFRGGKEEIAVCPVPAFANGPMMGRWSAGSLFKFRCICT